MENVTIWHGRLKPEQKLAAEYIVLNNYKMLEKGRKLTMVELAERVGVADRTIREWYKNKHWVEYLNSFAQDHLSSRRSEVLDALLGLATGEKTPNKVPSVNAIKLVLQIEGLLRHEIAVTNEFKQMKEVYASDEDIEAEMQALEALLTEDTE